jgi:hypothetical protein
VRYVVKGARNVKQEEAGHLPPAFIPCFIDLVDDVVYCTCSVDYPLLPPHMRRGKQVMSLGHIAQALCYNSIYNFTYSVRQPDRAVGFRDGVDFLALLS